MDSNKFEVFTQSGNKVFDLGEIVNIDDSNIIKEFTEQASRYAYFSQVLAYLDFNLDMLEQEKDSVYSRIDTEIREQAMLENKKTTEAGIKSTILGDERYINAQKDCTNAKFDANVVKSVVKALEQRADMLISLGSHIRHEYGMTGMNIREEIQNKNAKIRERLMENKNAKIRERLMEK